MAGIYSFVRTAIRNSTLKALAEYPTSPVIFSHLNGAEPSESYTIINILSIEQQGHHQTATLTNENEELNVSAVYEILVQFSFCGSLSGDMAHSFTQAINNSPVVLEELRRNKLGVLRKSTLRRAPQKRDTKWVEYQNMDVTFNYIVNTNQLVDVVEHILLEDIQTGQQIVIPPYVEMQLTTEDGNHLTTESGDILTTEGNQ